MAEADTPAGAAEAVLPGGTDLGDPAGLLGHLAEVGGPLLRSRTVERLVRGLGRAGRRFLDPGDPLRREAQRRVASEAGGSAEMARVVIEGMARDWTEERLDLLVRSDFPDPGVLDGPRPDPGGDARFAVGDRLAFHVVSGSVPGVGATSLLRSLLVKTPLLLKPGRGDRALPRLLARAIREEVPELAGAMAVAYWPGGSRPEIEDAALDAAERVVVYGASGTVEEIRSRIDPSVPLVAYPHRVSVGLVSREALARRAPALARSVARAAALFDQRGCVSPHLVWVEDGGPTSPEAWAAMVADECAGVASELPPGPLDAAEAARIHQIRGNVEVRAALADAVQGKAGRTAASEGSSGRSRLWAGPALSWTVVLDPDPAFAGSCGGRTLVIKPVRSLAEVPAILATARGVLQSAALEVAGSGSGEGAGDTPLLRALAEAGVTRITTLDRQPWPPAWWRHDGRGPLDVLVRWVSVEGRSST